MFYSITYYRPDKSFAYVDTHTFSKVNNAIIRAALHIQAHYPDIVSAAIVYQGTRVQKPVRTISLRNLEPKYS